MKLINKNIHTLTMKYPSSWHGALQREGLVCGNGKIGANIYGGVQRETMIINHVELWSGKAVQSLPDVSYCLKQTRQAMDEERFDEAHWLCERCAGDDFILVREANKAAARPSR